MDTNEYINAEEIAKMLGVTTITIYRYMKRTKNPLPHYRMTDRNFLVKKEDFDKWMESRFVS